jgi:hypothetical protein
MRRWMGLLLTLCMILGIIVSDPAVLAENDVPKRPITPNGAPLTGIIQPDGYLNEGLVFSLERPALVTVTARCADHAVFDLLRSDRYSIICKDEMTRKKLKDGTMEYRCSMYMEAGNHMLYASTSCAYDYAISYSISLKAAFLPASKTDPEPNNARETATFLPLNKTVHGLISDRDIDYYYFDLPKPSTVEFTAKQYKCRLDAFHIYHLSSRYNLIPHHPRKANRSLTTKFKMQLPKGRHYIKILDASNVSYPEDAAPRTGFYDFKVRAVNTLKPSIYMKLPSKVAAGTKVDMRCYTKPQAMGFADPKITLSNSDVASYNSDIQSNAYGLTALKTGTVKVSAFVKGTKKVTKTLRVVDNKYALKQPKMPKKPGVYVAHKLLRYSNGTVRGEVYLLNKTKYTIHGIANMGGGIYNRSGYMEDSTYIGNWIPERPIRPGKVGVVRFKMSVPPGEVPNFLSKKYCAEVTGDLLVSEAGRGLHKSYQPLEAISPNEQSA